MKLGVVILAATAVVVTVVGLGLVGGVPLLGAGVIAGLLALAMVQLLARGMTSPLRDMATASRAMAAGDYGRRISSNSRDEVGELARAFNAMAAEVQETDRIRRDLIANVSHELRTPISGLQAALENLVDGVVDGDTQMFGVMLNQTERLGRLVSELLDLSRLESGTVPLQLTAVPVHPLLEACANEARLLRPDVGVSITVTPPDLFVRGDQDRLRQVITNLVANALRVSTSDAPLELTATVGRASSPDGSNTSDLSNADGVVIEVRDHGPGISQAETTKVFERFYRADAARTPNDGGAGLGLAIVKWIVDLHEGSIAAQPNTPNGCRMVVWLPQFSRGAK